MAAILYGTSSGYVLRRTRMLAEELSRAQHRLVAAAAADERRRIAQDVHDLVAHSLAVALLNVTGARRAMQRDPALADEALARAEAVGRESLAGVRQVVGLLRDDTGAALGVGPLPDAHDLADL
nr:histidine kinase dimerization/phosphoacceptor domain-containing protein [Micromonospora sp. DSM 115978]